MRTQNRRLSRIRKTQFRVPRCVFAFCRVSGENMGNPSFSQRKDFLQEKIFVEEEAQWSDVAVLRSETAESGICGDEETCIRFACGK